MLQTTEAVGERGGAVNHDVPKIAESMTTPVHCVDIDDSVKSVKSLMLHYTIKHLPVMGGGELVGVLSDRDVKLAQAVANDPSFHETATVADVYRSNPYVVPSSERLDVVLSEMAQRRIGSAIVADAGRVVGIFTTTDACRCFAEFLQVRYGAGQAQTGELG